MKIKCDWCGKVFSKTPSNIKRHKNNFCGYDCHGKWNAINLKQKKKHDFRFQYKIKGIKRRWFFKK